MKREEAKEGTRVVCAFNGYHGVITSIDKDGAKVRFDNGDDVWIEFLLMDPELSSIDWEQRRYEIAKSVSYCFIQCNDGIASVSDMARWSVEYADALIKELKNNSNE